MNHGTHGIKKRTFDGSLDSVKHVIMATMKWHVLAFAMVPWTTLWALDLATSPQDPSSYDAVMNSRPISNSEALNSSPVEARLAIDQYSAAIHGAKITPMENAAQAVIHPVSAASASSIIRRPIVPLPRISPIKFNAWIADFDAAAGLADLDQDAGQLSEVSIFGLAFDQNDQLSPLSSFVTSAVQSAQRDDPRARILLTVTNDAGNVQKDPKAVDQVVNAPDYFSDLFVQRAVDAGVSGLDIDFENIPTADGPGYIQFIQLLAKKLHAQGLYLSVVIEPKTRFSSSFLDWTPIGQAADRVRVLGYNFSYETTPPGAISPPDQISTLADYALARIPASKLEIALPLHGYDWPDGKNGTQINDLSAILALAAQYQATIERDPATGAPHFSYVDGQGISHQVWYEDPESVWQKSQLLLSKGISNIGLWQIGSGDLSELFQLAHPNHPI